MNKRWIALLLMLAMVCMGAAAMATDEHYCDMKPVEGEQCLVKCECGKTAYQHSYYDKENPGICTECGTPCEHEFNGTARCINCYHYLCPHEEIDSSKICEQCSCTIYIVTYNPGEGSGTSITEKIVYKNNAVYELPECTFTAPENGTFVGWNVNGETKKAGSFFDAVDGMTITAVWEIEVPMLTVTFVANNGIDEEPYIAEIEQGTKTMLPLPELLDFSNKVNHTFEGWDDGEKTYTPSEEYEFTTSDVTLTACWIPGETADVCDLTFDYNGALDAWEDTGTIFADIKIGSKWNLPTQQELADDDGDYRVIIPDGWTLKEWDVDGTKRPIGYEVEVVEGLVITAIWNKSAAVTKYTVTFVANGGNGSMDAVEIRPGSEYTLPECGFTPANEMTFNCWRVNGQRKYPGDKITVSSDITVQADWAPAYSDFTFDPGEGTGTAYSKTVKFRDPFTIPECTFTAPRGYMFSHWEMAIPGGTEDWEPGDVVTSMSMDVTFTAIYVIDPDYVEPVTITFVANGGNGSMDAVEIRPGSEYTLPECGFTPANEMTFNCWRVNGQRKYPGDKITVSSDITVQADWAPAYSDFTFDPGEGTGTAYSKTVKFRDPFTIPECDFTAPRGYMFSHWEMAIPGGTEDWEPGDVVTSMSMDVTFTAIYVIDPDYVEPVTITFVANGGSGSMDVVEKKPGSEYTLPECGFIPANEMTFNCWRVNGQRKYPGDKITVSSDITVQADWAPAYSDFTFDPGEGTGTAYSKTVKFRDPFTIPECTFTAPTDKKFSHWAMAIPGGTEDWEPGDVVASMSMDVTFTAIWIDKESRTVTFAPNGASNTMAKVTVKEGDSYELPACGFVRDGYAFTGWLVNGETKQPTDSITVDVDVTVTAQWRELGKYIVTFDGNGGAGSMANVTVREDNTTYTLPSCRFTEPKGHHFVGWLVNGESKQPSDTITVNANVTVKAVWEKNIYQITIKNSEINDGEQETTAQVAYGTQYTLESVDEYGFNPVEDYYTFAHWKVVADGVEFKLGAQGSMTIESNVTFTAMWDFDNTVEVIVEETEDIANLPPEEKAEMEAQLLGDMPAELDTIEEVVAEIKEEVADLGFEAENVVVHDVTLKFKEPGGTEWIVATPENFPTAGILYEEELPEGTNATDYEFVAVHMFLNDSTRLGTKKGGTETLYPTVVNGKLRMTLNGLSPVTIAYRIKPTSEAAQQVGDLPQTGDPSSLMAWVTLLGASGLGMRAIKRRKK